MTLTDELKVLEEKIKAKYILDNEATKISILSSKELNIHHNKILIFDW